jgi:general secretion pathway protein K
MNCKSQPPLSSLMPFGKCGSVKGQKRGCNGRTILNERGVALLLVLWILVILSVIVFSFSVMTRTDGQTTLSFREKAEEEFLADAGVERGITELYYRSLFKNKQQLPDSDEPVRVDGTRNTGRLGGGAVYVYRISDEAGKIDLNALTDASILVLNNLLVNMGVPKEQADTITDSVLDWKDADELHRLHGAESDYYQSLPNPYKSKNGNFETVEELQMVKGMTSEILYGTENKPGIFDLLTTHSGSRGINLNSASRQVVAALPGMTPELTDRIVALRTSPETAGIQNALSSALGPDTLKSFAQYIGFSESNVYTIESTGYASGRKQGLTVRATVQITGAGEYRCTYYKSPAGRKKRQEEEVNER